MLPYIDTSGCCKISNKLSCGASSLRPGTIIFLLGVVTRGRLHILKEPPTLPGYDVSRNLHRLGKIYLLHTDFQYPHYSIFIAATVQVLCAMIILHHSFTCVSINITRTTWHLSKLLMFESFSSGTVYVLSFSLVSNYTFQETLRILRLVEL